MTDYEENLYFGNKAYAVVYEHEIDQATHNNLRLNCNKAVRYMLKHDALDLKDPTIMMGSVGAKGEFKYAPKKTTSIEDFYSGGFCGHFWIEDGDYIYDYIQPCFVEDDNEDATSIMKIPKNDTGDFEYVPASQKIQDHFIDYFVTGDTAP